MLKRGCRLLCGYMLVLKDGKVTSPGEWEECSRCYCRPLIYDPPPLKGLSIRIPLITHMNGRGFIN